MKWWNWLILELLIIFEVIAWVYFFPSEIEYDFAKGLFGFVLINGIEECRNINRRKTMDYKDGMTEEEKLAARNIEETCFAKAERVMLLRYINGIAWEKLATEELKRLCILIGNELESYCQKNNLYDCKKYDCPWYSKEVDPDDDPCTSCDIKNA